MKRVKDLNFFKNIREVREFEFGIFYYFDGMVISEVKEGVVFGWEMAQKAVRAAHEVFGVNKPIAYISNRINNYHVLAMDWAKFYKNREQLISYAVVGQTHGSLASLVLEHMFFKNSIQQFSDIEEAIKWSLTKIEHTQEFV